MLEAKTIYQGETPTWLVGHDTDGNGTLADLSSGYTCKIKLAGTAIDRAVTVFEAGNLHYIVSLTSAETTALAVGQYIFAIQIANASLGFNSEDQGILTVNTQIVDGTDTPDIASLELADLKQDRADVWSAIMASARGERIKDVWRDGRRVMRENMKVSELNDLLYRIDRMIQTKEFEMGTSTRPGRRAIGLIWG